MMKLRMAILAGMLTILTACAGMGGGEPVAAEPFSLHCDGLYKGAFRRDSEIEFKASFYPAFEKGVVFEIDGRALEYGDPRSFEGPKALFAMEDETIEMRRQTEKTIRLGELRFDRETGAFEMRGLKGVCKAVDFIDRGVKAGRQF